MQGRNSQWRSVVGEGTTPILLRVKKLTDIKQVPSGESNNLCYFLEWQC